MRTVAALAVAAGFCIADAGVRPLTGIAQADATARVMAETRQALGGDARIAAVKTLVITGRTRQVRGENLVPIEFEMQVEFPDRFSRRDEIPAQDAGPTTTGFNGDAFIQIPAPPTPVGRPGGPPPPTPEQVQAANRGRAVAAKQDFARLMLGFFATSYSSFPLTFAYAGQAEAPQGRADVVDVSGPGDFRARLFVHSVTHLPIMVSWQTRTPPGRGGPAGAPPGPGAQPGRGGAAGAPPAAGPPTGAGASRGAPAGVGAAPAGAGAPPAVENRLYFAEYREVDGLQLPFRVRRAVGADTVEETTFDRFRVNARVDPRRFEPGN